MVSQGARDKALHVFQMVGCKPPTHPYSQPASHSTCPLPPIGQGYQAKGRGLLIGELEHGWEVGASIGELPHQTGPTKRVLGWGHRLAGPTNPSVVGL